MLFYFNRRMNYLTILTLCSFVVSYGTHALPAQRVVGGTPVDINRYPFAAALLTNFGTTTYIQECGGAILTTSSILTAASCFFGPEGTHPSNQWRVRVGSTYANSGGIVQLIRSIVINEFYALESGDNDIAVIRTSFPITFATNTVSSVPVAGISYSLNTNQAISAIGWGTLTNEPTLTELREVEFWVVDHEVCKNRYRSVDFTVTDNMICAGWLDVGVRAQCLGDVGSPLLHNGFLIGVYTWTYGDCTDGYYPGINTKVAAYTQWIVANSS